MSNQNKDISNDEKSESSQQGDMSIKTYYEKLRKYCKEIDYPAVLLNHNLCKRENRRKVKSVMVYF